MIVDIPGLKLPGGDCHVQRGEDGTLTIIECGEVFLCQRVIIEQMIDTHNKFQRVVAAAQIIVDNAGDDGDFDTWCDGQDMLAEAVAAL